MRPARQSIRSEETYFVTSQTWQRRALFRNERWAKLFLETLHSYRGRAYLLHEYVLMPEHFHVLITPSVTLERAVQFIKGGFSYRVKKELQSSFEIWQTGFSDHRIREAQDYENHVGYIWRNPIGRKLVESAAEYPYCSAFHGSLKDDVPQRLKPRTTGRWFVAPEGATLQKQIPRFAREDNSSSSNSAGAEQELVKKT